MTVDVEQIMEYACDELCKYPSEYKDSDDLWSERCDRYGVSKKTMQNAINGVTWKCVPYFPEPPKEE